MCKCSIQWIDDKGQATPDTNEAFMVAQFHKPIHAAYTAKVLEYSSEIQDSYPICADHYRKVTLDMRFPVGGWSFVPLES